MKKRISICSDELYPIHDLVVEYVKTRGFEPVCFGALSTRQEEPWAIVAREAAESIARGECDEGIFFCWTGTGISIAANKIPGIRAALCTDVETAKGARVWNHANVLALSNRLMTPELVREILDAWFSTPFEEKGKSGVEELEKVDQTFRRRL